MRWCRGSVRFHHRHSMRNCRGSYAPFTPLSAQTEYHLSGLFYMSTSRHMGCLPPSNIPFQRTYEGSSQVESRLFKSCRKSTCGIESSRLKATCSYRPKHVRLASSLLYKNGWKIPSAPPHSIWQQKTSSTSIFCNSLSDYY